MKIHCVPMGGGGEGRAVHLLKQLLIPSEAQQLDFIFKFADCISI